MDKRKIVQRFAESVIKSREAILGGNKKLANKYGKVTFKCWDQLNALGDEGKEELSQLFSHEDLGVRAGAAAFLLKYKTDESLSILKEISKGQGLVAFAASEAIKRWEEGTWNLE